MLLIEKFSFFKTSGDYVTIEEPPADKKGKRIMHEDEEVDGSDEGERARVDMLATAITGHKERARM